MFIDYRHCTAAVLLFVSLLASAATAEDAAPEKILFIGNSYTAGVKRGIEFFFQQGDADVELRFITPGGRRLSQHAGNEDTLRVIKEGDWDLVVLQEQSQLPSLPDREGEFMRAGVKLAQTIHKSNSNSIYFMTWGRRDGDKANPKVNPDFTTMQDRLSDAYNKLGQRTDSRVAPVGKAWAMVHQQSPELFKKLYARDGSHPSLHGAYLSGAVFYGTITGQDVRKIEPAMRGISPEEATALRQAASEAMANQARDARRRPINFI